VRDLALWTLRRVRLAALSNRVDNDQATAVKNAIDDAVPADRFPPAAPKLADKCDSLFRGVRLNSQQRCVDIFLNVRRKGA
jgi:hypothetical protein